MPLIVLPFRPCGTLRAWMIGLIAAIIIPCKDRLNRIYIRLIMSPFLFLALNQFFFFRFPAISIGNLCTQLLAYPLGVFIARVLPRVRILGMELNPGPFSIKEHVYELIPQAVMYNNESDWFLQAYHHDGYSSIPKCLRHRYYSGSTYALSSGIRILVWVHIHSHSTSTILIFFDMNRSMACGNVYAINRVLTRWYL